MIRPRVLTVPWLPANKGMALMAWLILLRRGIAEFTRGLTFVEEVEHSRQEVRDGFWVFKARWFFTKTWRSEYELAGLAAQLRLRILRMRRANTPEPFIRTAIDARIRRGAESRDEDYGAADPVFGNTPDLPGREERLRAYVAEARDLPTGRRWPWYAIPAAILFAGWSAGGWWLLLSIIVVLAPEISVRLTDPESAQLPEP